MSVLQRGLDLRLEFGRTGVARNASDLLSVAAEDDDGGAPDDEFGQVVADSVVEVRERLEQPVEALIRDRGAGGDAIRLKRMGEVVHADDAWIERARENVTGGDSVRDASA